MIRFFGYLQSYIYSLKIFSFSIISLIISVLIVVNYTFDINSWMLHHPSFMVRLVRSGLFYIFVFSGICMLNMFLSKERLPRSAFFYFLLLITPVIFALKVSVRAGDVLPELSDKYFITALQWPLKALIVSLFVFGIGYLGGYQKPYFGTSLNNLRLKPYYVLLLLMLPFLLMVGITPDFQSVYPRLQIVGDPSAFSWYKILFFEFCYGIDFFTIELFFRGFIIIAFTKYLGKSIILPMAFFYCVIHFGKPLMECISSYFGGIVLGAIVYRTHSIWGGLLVHLGIAWMIEIIGFVL